MLVSIEEPGAPGENGTDFSSTLVTTVFTEIVITKLLFSPTRHMQLINQSIYSKSLEQRKKLICTLQT